MKQINAIISGEFSECAEKKQLVDYFRQQEFDIPELDPNTLKIEYVEEENEN